MSTAGRPSPGVESAAAGKRAPAQVSFGCDVRAWPLLKEGVVEAGRLGFAGFEAPVEAVLPYDDRVGGVADLQAMAGAAAVRIAALSADLALADPDRREAEVGRAVHAARLLELLHGDRLVVTIGPEGAPPASVVAALDRIGGEARRHGVALCVRPHAGSVVTGASDLDIVLGGTDAHNVLFCAEAGGTAAAAGTDPAAMIRRFAARIGLLHLSDLDRVDLAPVFGALDDIAYRGWCVVHVAGGGAEAATAESATSAARSAREQLIRLGRWTGPGHQ